MRKIVLFTAISIDGFIARKDGDISWLNNPDYALEGEDYGYTGFYRSVDTTLMGNNTYRQIMGFGVPFPYPDKENYVLTRSESEEPTDEVMFVTGNIADFTRQLKEQEGEDIWLVGGGEVNAFMLENAFIDRLILTVMPVALGSGIPLFEGASQETQWKLAAQETYQNGVIQLIYDRL